MVAHYADNATLPAFVAWVHFSTDENPLSYAFQGAHRGVLVAHILLMSFATLVLLPAALFLRRSKFRLHLWAACCLVTLFGAGLARYHGTRTENLYEKAFHRPFGVGLIGLIIACTLYNMYFSLHDRLFASRRPSSARFTPVQQHHDDSPLGPSTSSRLTLHAASDDEDSARSSETLYRTRDDVRGHRDSLDDMTPLTDSESQSKEAAFESVGKTWSSTVRVTGTVLLLTAVYTQILLGVATYCGLFTDHEIFNGLAHWIKASIFFLFGIWVFLRYLGVSASIGHAWNVVPERHVSPETIECGLCFIYGISNLFLERLGHSELPISHTDIQHMSIAAIFAFAGAIGLLLESQCIRRLLTSASMSHDVPADGSRRRGEEMTYNVMPSLIVFFTGLLMSQHNQDTQFSSDVHKGWGYYFCIASVFRLVTYSLFFVSRAATTTTTRTRPGRPPTESLVAFCLIAGSILFMFSARDPVQVLEYYGIDLMFATGLSVAGALAVLMWVLYVVVLLALDRRRAIGEVRR